MERAVITVTPAAGGWAVSGSYCDEPLMFQSGGEAERQARRLAQLATEEGVAVTILVHDRHGRLVATLAFAPAYAAAGMSKSNLIAA